MPLANRWLLVALLSPFLLSACALGPRDRFAMAVEDAAVVQPKDIYTRLVAVTPDNDNLVWNADHTRVLVVMWKSRDNFDRFYKNQRRTASSQQYLTWVTMAHQVRDFGNTFFSRKPEASRATVDLRLKQYLGLDPNWRYDLFVEMWVSPQDLFRPCTDPEIDDTVCNIAFGDPPPQVKNIACYPCFYKNLYFNDFRTRPGIPWSGMGYTYDWGNPEAPFGASEFILVPGAPYTIHRVVATMDYLRPSRR